MEIEFIQQIISKILAHSKNNHYLCNKIQKRTPI